MKTDAEIARPDMPLRERIARIMARALGHNDENGMYWEQYALAADALVRAGFSFSEQEGTHEQPTRNA
jgi:hypothetical protein